MTHALLDILERAAAGDHPPVDGGVTFLPALAGGQRAVLALTGHAFVCTPQTAEDFGDLAIDGFGGALHPEALLRLAEGGTIGVNDVTLAAQGTGIGAPWAPTPAWDDHHRVRYARQIRSDVSVYGDEAGFFTLARGLAGRHELSIEITEPGSSPGRGRQLLADARAMAPVGSWLFAAVSPGNARSLRSFLAAGFTPIGSEVLIESPSL